MSAPDYRAIESSVKVCPDPDRQVVYLDLGDGIAVAQLTVKAAMLTGAMLTKAALQTLASTIDAEHLETIAKNVVLVDKMIAKLS